MHHNYSFSEEKVSSVVLLHIESEKEVCLAKDSDLAKQADNFVVSKHDLVLNEQLMAKKYFE